MEFVTEKTCIATKTQKQWLEAICAICRRFYNDYLAERKIAYQERGA
jgi:hypothetical protein